MRAPDPGLARSRPRACYIPHYIFFCNQQPCISLLAVGASGARGAGELDGARGEARVGEGLVDVWLKGGREDGGTGVGAWARLGGVGGEGQNGEEG